MHLSNIIAFSLVVTLSAPLFAADPKKPEPKPQPAKMELPKAEEVPAATSAPEEVDVDKLKEKYWLRGGETEMGVVQNRLYRKSHKIELGGSFGNINGDPFLSIYSIGFNAGYHFSEFLGLHFIYFKPTANSSSALKTLEAETGSTANTNPPSSYMGAEARASVLYGKLSLLGAAILHFDAYFSLGGGKMATETGSNLALTAGIGQQIHLTQLLTMSIDYKFMWYRERIVSKGALNAGADMGVRSNLSNVIQLGLCLYIDLLGGGKV